MKKFTYTLAFAALFMLGIGSSFGQLITNASGQVGIGLAPSLSINKLDVRGSNIFLSPFTTPGIPSQFIGIGESGGPCDIYGVRVARPNSTNLSQDRFLNFGVKEINFILPPNQISFAGDAQVLSTQKSVLQSGTEVATVPVSTFTAFQPVISWGSQGSLDFEYDANENGCGVDVLRLFGPNSTYQAIVSGTFKATSLFVSSDRRIKDNIRGLDNALDIVMQLEGHSYMLNEEASRMQDAPVHTGFLAQEVEQVLPELVRQDENGLRAVNYLEVVPILTEALKDQDLQIASQEEELAALEKELANLMERAEQMLETEAMLAQAQLLQNSPNPFFSTTTIRYVVPAQANEANILVYDVNGKMVKRFDLQAGQGSVNLSGGELGTGIYVYTLFVDGNKVATKRMAIQR